MFAIFLLWDGLDSEGDEIMDLYTFVFSEGELDHQLDVLDAQGVSYFYRQII